MNRFLNLNLKELKQDVDTKIEDFLKNKKAKMTSALKSNIDRCILLLLKIH